MDGISTMATLTRVLTRELDVRDFDAALISIQENIELLGWKNTVKSLKEAIADTCGNKWFEINRIVFSLAGVPELVGIDCDALKLLEMLEPCRDIGRSFARLRKKIYRVAQNQIESGYSTLFLDIDAIAASNSSALIPAIMRNRMLGFTRITDFLENRMISNTDDGLYDVLPVWTTVYGYKIMSELGLSRYISESELIELKRVIREISRTFVVVPEYLAARTLNSEPSTRFMELVSLLAESGSRTDWCSPLIRLFEIGYYDFDTLFRKLANRASSPYSRLILECQKEKLGSILEEYVDSYDPSRPRISSDVMRDIIDGRLLQIIYSDRSDDRRPERMKQKIKQILS